LSDLKLCAHGGDYQIGTEANSRLILERGQLVPHDAALFERVLVANQNSSYAYGGSEGEAHLFEQAFLASTRLPVFC
jgi:hypothetical protein